MSMLNVSSEFFLKNVNQAEMIWKWPYTAYYKQNKP